MCSTYTKDDSKCEKDSRGNEFKKGEWNPYCALNLGCCELGCLQPPIACMCYTTPSEGQGTWLWGSIGMGGWGTSEKKSNGDVVLEHGRGGPCHGGFCCLRGSWSGKVTYVKKGGAPVQAEEMER